MRLVFAASVASVTRACSDESSWQSPHGEACSWYAEHDPGCTRFSDVGQLQHCRSTCANCDGSRPVPDPMVTTCAWEDLCRCFERCDPPVLCPISDAAQTCSTQVLEALAPPSASSDGLEIASANSSDGLPYLEWDLAGEHHVLGFEVAGHAGRWARTVSAKFVDGAKGGSADWQDVDGGRKMAANWDEKHTVRISFLEPVQPETLRLYPVDLPEGVSAGSLPLSAAPVVQKCSDPPYPVTVLGRCYLLMCKAYCYSTLGCQGQWQAHCEQEKLKDGDFCTVDCSAAPRARGGGGSPGVLLLALAWAFLAEAFLW